MSWNCGVEGPTDDPEIEAIRRRQIKNFLVVNLLSLGVPMLLMGDEVRRTQGGNNNAYCPDDATSWFDWSAAGPPRRHPAFHQGPDPDAPPAGEPARRARRDQPPRHPRQRVARMERGRPSASPTSRTRRAAWRSRCGPGRAPSTSSSTPTGSRSSSSCPRSTGRSTGWRRIVDTSLDAPDDLALTFSEATPSRRRPIAPRRVRSRSSRARRPARRQGKGALRA